MAENHRVARFVLVSLLAAAWAGRGLAQAPYLVQDLNTQATPGSVRWGEPFSLGDKVIFYRASEQSLWVTDGTLPGTGALADFRPGGILSDLLYLGAIDGVLIGSTSTTPDPNARLWRSDGTPAGSYLLPGPGPSPLMPLFDHNALEGSSAIAGGFLYFNGASGAGPDSGQPSQVWRTDGTAAGTRPFEGLAPLAGKAAVSRLTSFGGKLYFFVNAFDGTSALWTTDGTVQGTVALVDLGRSSPRLLTRVGNRLVFTIAADLWVSDGTAAGTRAVASFASPIAFDATAFFKPAGDHAFFVADDCAHGLQLWVSNGTAAGTVPLTNFTNGNPFGFIIPSFAPTLGPSQIEEVNGQAVFIASDNGRDFAIWSAPTSPAPAGPSQVALCSQGCANDAAIRLVKVGGRVLFRSFRYPPAIGSTDGTPAGTSLVLRCGAGCLSMSELTPLLGAAFVSMAAQPGPLVLWRSDGTAAGTVPFATPGPDQQQPDLAALGGEVVYPTGGALWASDGTPAGTRQLSATPIDDGSSPDDFVVQGDHLVFTASTSFRGPRSLFETDGAPGSSVLLAGDARTLAPLAATASRTYLVRYIDMGEAGPGPDQLWKSDAANPVPTEIGDLPGSHLARDISSLAIFLDQLFLAFGSVGQQVFKSDGTAAGTGPAFGLPPGYLSPRNLTPLGTDLYFTGDGPGGGNEVLASDGTAPGTRALSHFGSARSACDPRFTRVGSQVFFAGWDAASGRELWKTDGTPGGTTLVADLVPGAGGSNPSELTEHQGALYFFAFTSDGRKSLWRSDGTPQGTVQVADFPSHPAPLACVPDTSSLTSTGALLFFVADDGIHGRELWKSDGTAAGTALVRDIAPGPVGSLPSALRAAAGQLFFTADDGTHGRELWRSDGSDAGTRMVADLRPGPESSRPRNLTVVGNRLLFDADDGEVGEELWALPLTGNGGCQASATVLCVQGNRFAVTISWQDFAGHAGSGQAVAITADTGYFWFFAADNVEVVVKVLDGRPLNGAFWVFYGAPSSVRYALTVTDTATGLTRRYENLANHLASTADTQAFGSTGVNTAAGTAPPGHLAAAGTADSSRLLLNGNRFAVEASWTDFTGRSGNGVAAALTGDTGYFWFFAPENVEVVLKVLDGRAVNGKFWVFYGALSSVEYTLTVTDTLTGAVRTYHNPSGQLASFADTSAF
jgi:ELWxxDGT repeat protein